MQTYHGSCHCGAVKFEIDAELDKLNKCDCSLCRKKNAVMLGVHKDNIRINTGEDQLTLYQWNKKIAKHYFCKKCGIYTFHQRRVTPEYFGVNAHCLDDVDVSSLPISVYDGVSMTTVDEES